VLLARGSWKVTLFLLLGTAFVWGAFLHELNQFADNSTPSRETLVIESVGKYYAPFRVDYLSGRSGLLGKSIDVPVLAEVAAQSKVGDRIDVVIGKGCSRGLGFSRTISISSTTPLLSRRYTWAFPLFFLPSAPACISFRTSGGT